MPPQNKVMLQRQYREKEGECFNALRDAINELTGEELQTRYEILRKAIDLLLTASHLRKLKEAESEIVRPMQGYEAYAFAVDPGHSHIGLSPELPLSQWSEGWQYSAESAPQLALYGQQHDVMLNTGPALNPTDPQGYVEDWSHYF